MAQERLGIPKDSSLTCHLFPIVPQIGDHHEILRQRSGLVRSDHRRRSQLVDHVESLDVDVLLSHSPRDNGKLRHDGGWQPLWHVCDDDDKKARYEVVQYVLEPRQLP